MGYAGSSLHVKGFDQTEVARQIAVALAAEGFSVDHECQLPQLPASDRRLFRGTLSDPGNSDSSTPHRQRPVRAFILSPRISDWVSVFEYGEYYDLDLAQSLSKGLNTKVVAALWEEHVGAQMVDVFRNGMIADHFHDAGTNAGFSCGNELSSATPQEFSLEDYIHGDLKIPLGYCFRFADALLDPAAYVDVCSIEDLRLLKFSQGAFPN